MHPLILLFLLSISTNTLQTHTYGDPCTIPPSWGLHGSTFRYPMHNTLEEHSTQQQNDCNEEQNLECIYSIELNGELRSRCGCNSVSVYEDGLDSLGCKLKLNTLCTNLKNNCISNAKCTQLIFDSSCQCIDGYGEKDGICVVNSGLILSTKLSLVLCLLTILMTYH